MSRYNRDRNGIRLVSSSTSTSTTRHHQSSWMSHLVPWVALGLSMGVGYFSLESLMAWYKQQQHSSSNYAVKTSNRKNQRKHPLYYQLVNQLEQLKQTLNFSDISKWIFQWWTFSFLRHDIIWGVFLTVMPSPNTPQNSQHPSRILKSPLTTKQQQPQPSEVLQLGEGDVFQTLPPQLQPQLPPKAPIKTTTVPTKERYLEMLLHNISHTDLVLGLDVIESSSSGEIGSNNNNYHDLKSMCLCRPRFSAFDMYCRKLFQALDDKAEIDKAEVILVPQYQRSQSDPRYTIQPSGRPHVSTGFCWNTTTTTTTTEGTSTKDNNTHQNNNPRIIPLTQALADLRVRGKDMAKLEAYVRPNTTTEPGSPRVYQDLNEDRCSSPTVATWNIVSAIGSNNNEQTAPPQTPRGSTVADDTNNNNKKSKEDILVELKAIFFPLLSTLLPRWLEQISQKYSKWRTENVVEKVLVLVTGVGTPRNWTHSITGNSTQVLADLMELFLAKVYPDITVVKIHSDTNIFRYDDNILFVQQELLPCVNAYRDAHATQAPYPHEISAAGARPGSAKAKRFEQQLQPQAQQSQNAFDVDWKRSFSVTLSFADGSPARTHAIQTALRMFRPTYFHIWQLKTFWHERKIVDDDVEVHSFEEMETSPALESNLLRGELAQVVHEMKAFRYEMTQTLLKTDDNDIHSFWLRKTHKPVLAVLLVQSEGQQPVLYRGTNMEVSMPTGSLCAERNVIGTALASNPKLKRQDLKCIAVLAVPPPPSSGQGSKPRSESHGNASDICTSCKSSRQSSFDDAPTSTMSGRQMRRQSFDEKEEDDWMIGDTNKGNNAVSAGKTDEGVMVEDTTSTEEGPSESREAPLRQISLFSSNSSNSLVDMIKQHPSGVPSSPHTSRHKTSTATTSSPGTVIQEKRTVIVRSNNHDVDLNPLSPCGSCHEWLKKIAECNPYFQILTFTDADCNGVYVTPCQE